MRTLFMFTMCTLLVACSKPAPEPCQFVQLRDGSVVSPNCNIPASI